MADAIWVYKADTQVELGRFDTGTMEADLWQELVTPNAKGRLLRSSGVRVTQGSTAVAQGNYYLHAVEAAVARPAALLEPAQPPCRPLQGSNDVWVTQGSTAPAQGAYQYQAAYPAVAGPANLLGPGLAPYRSLQYYDGAPYASLPYSGGAPYGSLQCYDGAPYGSLQYMNGAPYGFLQYNNGGFDGFGRSYRVDRCGKIRRNCFL